MHKLVVLAAGVMGWMSAGCLQEGMNVREPMDGNAPDGPAARTLGIDCPFVEPVHASEHAPGMFGTAPQGYEWRLVAYESRDHTCRMVTTTAVTLRPSSGYAGNPAIVFAHGFSEGSHGMQGTSISTLTDLAAGFPGWTIVGPDYRGGFDRDGDGRYENPNESGFPEGVSRAGLNDLAAPPMTGDTQVLDIIGAIGAVRELGADPDRVYLIGHSYGGGFVIRVLNHLHETGRSNWVKRAVFWSGLSNYTDRLRNPPHENAWQVPCAFDDGVHYADGRAGQVPVDMANWFFDADVNAGCQAFSARSPHRAYSHDQPWVVPLFIAVGTNDTLVPMGPNGADLASVLRSEGKTVEYKVYEGANHNFTGAPLLEFGKDLARFFGTP
jgi:pimeloyl-ACP methyl ester carboxylesterase